MANENSTGKAIVITGVSKGLGRAVTEEFLLAGHRVYGCARTAVELGAARIRTVDVARDDEVALWATEVLRDIKAPDLLINNAAMINQPAPLWEVSAREFDRVMAVNLSGVANVLRHFVPAMVARGTGVIVNLSSGWGRSTAPEVGPYCTTKWGIEGLSASLADDLPSGLASIAVNPGVIDTEMLRTCWGEGAGGYESPSRWASRAAGFFLGLGVSDNGRSLTVT